MLVTVVVIFRDVIEVEFLDYNWLLSAIFIFNSIKLKFKMHFVLNSVHFQYLLASIPNLLHLGLVCPKHKQF